MTSYYPVSFKKKMKHKTTSSCTCAMKNLHYGINNNLYADLLF